MAQQDVAVSLIPVMNGNGSFNSWQMSVNKGAPFGPGNYPVIQVTKGNNADVTFTIQNGQNQSITFASILVPAESKEIHNVKGQGTATLTFEDHNWNQNQIPYVVLFNKAPKLDPIIGNDGGGPTVFNTNYLVDAAGALAIALIVFFLTRKMYKSQVGRSKPVDERSS